MKRPFFAALALAALTAAHAGRLDAQQDITGFYDTADSATAHPPFRSELTTFCQVKLLDRWISFVGFKGTKSALYVTFTLDSLPDPVGDVSPIVGYEKGKPDLGKVSTWGYIFDRNRDGKVDYLALVGGAAPFEDAAFPDDYPKRGQPMLMPHVELFIAKCKIVFNHWADDNYDGRIDATVQADMDPERDWVYRQILARQTKFDGRFDEVTAFRSDGSAFRDTVTFTPDRVPFRPLGSPAGSIGDAELDGKSAVMALINQAYERFGKEAFRLPSGYQKE